MKKKLFYLFMFFFSSQFITKTSTQNTEKKIKKIFFCCFFFLFIWCVVLYCIFRCIHRLCVFIRAQNKIGASVQKCSFHTEKVHRHQFRVLRMFAIYHSLIIQHIFFLLFSSSFLLLFILYLNIFRCWFFFTLKFLC